MSGLTSLFIILLFIAGISIQACPECECCIDGENACESDNNCKHGCKDGYYGDKCTEKCPENCKTCKNKFSCTECKTGNYTSQCNVQCGKGCLNKTCDLKTGNCKCKSPDFQEGKCQYCSGNKYGNECNYTCPSNCGTCSSETSCSWCKDNLYYGSYCQYRCSYGCEGGECNKNNGHCNIGCQSHYTGYKCETCSSGLYGEFCDLSCTENCSACFSKLNCTECKSGFYGEACAESCPPGCKGTCLFADGSCMQCKPNLSGLFCNNTCKNGTFGVNCSQKCSDEDENCQKCIANELDVYINCTKCNRGYYPDVSDSNWCTSCPKNCKDNVCSTSGLCANGCMRGKWGDNCSSECNSNCVECNQRNGNCLKCPKDTFSGDCSLTCSKECNKTGNNTTCAIDTGKCLQGCVSFTKYGDFCDKQCSDNCINKTCDHVKGHCLHGCKNGFHGNRCNDKCSSQCVNKICNQLTAECLNGCMDGYEKPTCVQASRKIVAEKTKLPVTIAANVGGVIFVILVAVLAICVIKRKRGHKQRQPSDKKSKENEPIQTMQEICTQDDETELAAVYAEPFQSTHHDSDDGAEYATTYDDCKKISGNKNYAEVQFVNKEYESMKEEEYDTTHDKTSDKPLNSNHDYALLNVRSAPNGAQSEDADVYDTTVENNENTFSRLNKEYDFFNGDKGNKLGYDTSNTVYDTTCEDSSQKPRPVNNDYDEFSINNK